MIWKPLKKRLDSEELIKILAIFNETPREKISRLVEYPKRSFTHSKFWIHETTDSSKYWLFVDVGKFKDEYKSSYIIINQKENFKHVLTFVYTQEIIEFMELEPNEIYNELYNNIFSNGESEIKVQIMNKYNELTKKDLYGNSNIFDYVFKRFELTSIHKYNLIFTPEEIKMLSEALTKYDDFGIKNDLTKAIEISKKINELKTSYL